LEIIMEIVLKLLILPVINYVEDYSVRSPHYFRKFLQRFSLAFVQRTKHPNNEAVGNRVIRPL